MSDWRHSLFRANRTSPPEKVVIFSRSPTFYSEVTFQLLVWSVSVYALRVHSSVVAQEESPWYINTAKVLKIQLSLAKTASEISLNVLKSVLEPFYVRQAAKLLFFGENQFTRYDRHKPRLLGTDSGCHTMALLYTYSTRGYLPDDR